MASVPPIRTLSVSALIALSPLGCYATAHTHAYAGAEPVYVETDYIPVHVETYPRYEYAGRTVYLVDGHWYYRRGPRWVYFRDEPEELARRRLYVESAPPAPERHRAHRHRRPHHPHHD